MLGRWKQGDSWGALADQPSLIGELQASERLCHKNQNGARQWCILLIPAFGGQRKVNLCEFASSLVYTDQPKLHSETLISKNTNRCLGNDI